MAARIRMTAMPQLVAALHSFVGLAAVLVAIGTFLNKRDLGQLNAVLMGELSAGAIIGAITFTGSVIAFGAYLTLLGRIGAHKAGYAMVMFPVVALILSFLFEGLELDLTIIVGTALVLVGNVFVLETRSKSHN